MILMDQALLSVTKSLGEGDIGIAPIFDQNVYLNSPLLTRSIYDWPSFRVSSSCIKISISVNGHFNFAIFKYFFSHMLD